MPTLGQQISLTLHRAKIKAFHDKRVMSYEEVGAIIDKGIAQAAPTVKAPKPKPNPALAEVIERVYQAYPRKMGKGKALDSIRVQLRSVSAEVLLQKTQAYAAHCIAIDQDRQFIPFPSTWYNQQRYLDELETPQNRDAPDYLTENPLG